MITLKKTEDACSVIIVTHNSEKTLKKCIDSLLEQIVKPHQIIIIDSGSFDLEYLKKYQTIAICQVIIEGKNIGFCSGNNLGISKISPDINYVLFLNPDAFISPSFIQDSVAYMKNEENCRCGALTGTVFGYNMEQDTVTGRYDSTGIFQKWWGKWIDRAQGTIVNKNLYVENENIPAICGAVFFARKSALDSVLIKDNEVFDNHFYMYKEDIDLSLRLRREGWLLTFVPHLIAYHCRGWNNNRTLVAKKMRLLSAKNELSIHMRNKSPIPILYSLAKYGAVKWFNK